MTTQTQLKHFLGRLLILTLTLLGVIGVLWGYAPALIHEHILYIVCYQACLALLTYVMVGRGIDSKDPYDFYNNFMGATTIRLILSAVVLLVYIVNTEKSHHLLFAMTFFVLYIFYTVFEIITLLYKLRPNSETKTEQNEKSIL